MDVAILLDGDFTRRLLKRKFRRNASPADIRRFTTQCLHSDERIVRTYYYDCPPFDGIRKRPVSKGIVNFSTEPVFAISSKFQATLKQSNYFIFRKGRLSFDGWAIKEQHLAELIHSHRILADDDFEPVLTQKQVDMKIGLDIATLSYRKIVRRILLATADSDFIPAIHHARDTGLEVILISDGHSSLKIKSDLIRSCNDHRIV